MKSAKEKIELEQFYNHPPSSVWLCLTDPDLHAKWWAAGDVRAEVGHKFELDMGTWGKQKCEVLAVENERLLKYLFASGVLDTTITFELIPEKGGTKLKFTQEGFNLESPMGRQALEGMGRGWPGLLKGMDRALQALGMQDRIEKQILLNTPRSRVWKAISDSKQFGLWFGMDFDGPFKAGQTLFGKIVPTTVDPDVAKLQEPHRGKKVEFYVDRIEPETKLCFKWHPYAIDPNIDYSSEPMTLITFFLEEKGANQTLLTITEEGFENLPLSRRAEALLANDGGWAHQRLLLQKYLSK